MMEEGSQERQFLAGSMAIIYSFQVNRRRKYPCIIAKENGKLLLEAPAPMTEKAAKRFLKANEGWIISVFQKDDDNGTFRNGTVTLDGEEIPYYIAINKRRKRVAITIRDDLGIEIRSPIPLSHEQARRTIDDLSAWIRKTRSKKIVRREHMLSRQYAEGETIPYQGRLLTIRHTGSEGALSASIRGDELWIAVPDGISPEGSLPQMRGAVMECYAEEIRPLAEEIAARSAEKIGVPSPLVRFGYQKRRFGSCTPRNGIIINLKIAMAPPAYLEYTIIHEVCHLVERNHQQGFWDLVESLLPSYKQLHDHLQKDGGEYTF